MENKFEELYLAWKRDPCHVSSKMVDYFENEPYKKLQEWCKEHRKEALEGITGVLKEGPSFIVHLLPEILEVTPEVSGYVSLERYCDWWMETLNRARENLSDEE